MADTKTSETACAESKMDDGSHSALFGDGGFCDWCGEKGVPDDADGFPEHAEGRSMIGIISDPGVPPGVVIMDSGIDRIAKTIGHPGAPSTPELMEDVRSFTESFPFVIRLSRRGEPFRCECCGTLVALTPEALSGTQAAWRPAIWEHETYRKHTLRRCKAVADAPVEG